MSNQNFQYAPPPDPQRQRYGVPPAQNQQYLQAMQQQAEAGLRYCRDCGAPVQPGSTVCLNCNYIINPEAFRQAQRLVRSRNTPPPPPPSARQAARSGQRRSTRRTPQPRSVSGGDVGEIIGSAAAKTAVLTAFAAFTEAILPVAVRTAVSFHRSIFASAACGYIKIAA